MSTAATREAEELIEAKAPTRTGPSRDNPQASQSECLTESKVPVRDWIVLPLLGVLTIVFLLVTTELIARRIFPDPPNVKGARLGDCLVTNDPTTGARAIPNSVCRARIPEAGPVEYRFNSCGHRAGMECGQKPAGTYRIVLIGTSTTLGWGVSREQTFPALLPAELSRRTGRKIDVYNEAMMWQSPLVIVRRFDQVLAAKPDMILWIMTPWSMTHASEMLPADEMPAPAEKGPKGSHTTLVGRVRETLARKSLSDLARDAVGLFRQTKIEFMFRHFLYQSQTQYMVSFLRSSGASELRTEPPADLREALPEFDNRAAEIVKMSKSAGVPLVVVMVPDRGQAAMISQGTWPAGYDPYALGRYLREIIERDGGTYIDILPDYRDVPNSAQGYFPNDSHPTAKGHETISRLLTKELTTGAIPALKAVAQPQTGMEREKK